MSQQKQKHDLEFEFRRAEEVHLDVVYYKEEVKYIRKRMEDLKGQVKRCKLLRKKAEKAIDDAITSGGEFTETLSGEC